MSVINFDGMHFLTNFPTTKSIYTLSEFTPFQVAEPRTSRQFVRVVVNVNINTSIDERFIDYVKHRCLPNVESNQHEQNAIVVSDM